MRTLLALPLLLLATSAGAAADAPSKTPEKVQVIDEARITCEQRDGKPTVCHERLNDGKAGLASVAVEVLDKFGSALREGRTAEAATYLHPNLLVYEGGEAENLKAYLEYHLGEDAKFLKDTEVESRQRRVRAVNDLVLVTTEDTVLTKTIRLVVLETAALIQDEGQWKILHLHWSSRFLAARGKD